MLGLGRGLPVKSITNFALRSLLPANDVQTRVIIQVQNPSHTDRINDLQQAY